MSLISTYDCNSTFIGIILSLRKLRSGPIRYIFNGHALSARAIFRYPGAMDSPTPAPTRAPFDPAGRIVYEDNHILVMNKLPGEITQGDKTGDPSMVDDLKAYLKERDGKPGEVFLGLVHRLDRPTSGIVVFAKTSKALTRLTGLFRDRDLEKVYWAIVEGRPDPSLGDGGELVHWLSRNEKKNVSKAWSEAGPGRQEARLEWRLAKTGERYSLLRIRLHTGRHHQIRAQLAAIGLHIKGDLKYGSHRSNPDGGICLHAVRLVLPHPVGRRPDLDLAAEPWVVQGDQRLWRDLGDWPPA